MLVRGEAPVPPPSPEIRMWSALALATPAAIVRELYRRHGALALVLGRFVAGVAPFVAPGAGWAGMAYRRFLPANALANLLWGPVMVGTGYLFGAQAARLEGPWRWAGLGLTGAVLAAAFWRLRAIAADLAKARAEAESYLDDLRRLQADFDNYRKRTLREQTARAASASQALVTRLLPVLDNFELAVSAAEQSRDFDRMLKGVEMVLGALREVLEGEGLVKIEAEGKPFDPERHEAVIAVEEEGAEPGMVVDIVRAGYELRGKVLRPAMVKVAK